jgi:dCMP deaminase
MRNIPDWDEYFKQIASATAQRSSCKRLQVGCVLVKDHRIISQGYNGFLPGCVHESIIKDGHEMATVHAEQNAISDCAKRGVSSNRTIAYITHYPCVNCMKVLCAAGINEIKYINDYNNDPIVDRLSAISKVPITQI